MTTPDDPAATAKRSSTGRRIAAAAMLGVLICAVLWIAAFSLATSLIIGSGSTVILVGAGSWSDAVEAVLDWLFGILAAILATIGAVFAAILSLFDL